MPDLQRLVQGALDALAAPGEKMTPRKAAQLPGVRGKVSYETIRKIVNGTHSGDLSEPVVDGLVALGISRSDIRRATGRTHLAELPKWQPPEAAHRMTLRQRRAVENLIAVLTEADDREMNNKSSAQPPAPGVAPIVTTERVDVGDETPIVLAGAGPLPPLTESESRYLDTLSDALFERVQQRILGQ